MSQASGNALLTDFDWRRVEGARVLERQIDNTIVLKQVKALLLELRDFLHAQAHPLAISPAEARAWERMRRKHDAPV